MSEGHVWDEERWEAYLREHDRRVERCMEHLLKFLREDPRPSERDRAALGAWEKRLEAHLALIGWSGAAGDLLFGAPPAGGEPDEEDDPREPWAEIERLPLYQHACRAARRVLAWSETIPGSAKDGSLVHFCSCVTHVGAYLTRGHALGYEHDRLGGYIAYARRALGSANAALEALQEMREAPYLTRARYRAFYEEIYELRNELGVYIQHLRRRFQLGVD